jgi:WD40 repeat protein
LASAGYRQVNLWHLGADAPLRTFKAHTDLVFGVAWSPDGASIASAGDDGIARVWSAETLLQTTTLQTGPARAVKWSLDGGRLAIGSGVRMQIWRAASRDLLHTALVQAQISSVSWSPDDKMVAVGSVNGMTTLWSAQTGALLAKMNAGDQGRNDVNGVTWSPGGRILATAHGARGRGEIRLWNPVTGRLVRTLPSPSGWLRGISWSPDGLWLAAGGEDGRVRIWSAESGEVVETLPTDSQPVWSVAWSPDGGLLAAGNTGSRVAGGTVSVWRAPVPVLPGESASNRARAVETTLLKRGANAAPTASTPPRVATVFRDDGGYGAVTGVEPPFGNLETNFVESDLRSLAIATGDTFHVRCREKSVPLLLGTSVDEVARGEWVAYFSLEGSLMVARYFGNAAEESGCKVGDSVFVARRRQFE